MWTKVWGGPGHGRQEKSAPSEKEKEEQVCLEASPAPGRGRDTALQGGFGVAAAQDHPPLLADEQEQKHDQACDECQADPNDGPGVIAGPCRGHGGVACQPWPGGSSRAWRAASSAVSQPRARTQATSSSTKLLLQDPAASGFLASQCFATTSWGCVTWDELLYFSEPQFSYL